MILLFPEVEVTKSLSNVIKAYNAKQLEPLIIDSEQNETVIRITETIEKQQSMHNKSTGFGEPDEFGFAKGLFTTELTEEELAALSDEDRAVYETLEGGEGLEWDSDIEDAHEAALIVEEAYQEAEQIRNDAQALAEDMKAQGFAQGKEDGYQQGLKDAADEIARRKAELEEQINARQQELEQEFEDNLTALEPKFVEVLCQLLERLTGVVVTGHKDIMLYLINNAMRDMENSHSFVVSVSEQDFEYVNKNKENIYGYLNPSVSIELFQDAKLLKNQCRIETEGGLVDLSLDVQMSQLIKSLMLLNA